MQEDFLVVEGVGKKGRGKHGFPPPEIRYCSSRSTLFGQDFFYFSNYIVVGYRGGPKIPQRREQ